MHVLCCKHAYEVWDKVHKHFNTPMKDKVHQLRFELKITKKASHSIYKYVMQIRATTNSHISIGVWISEWDQIDVILQGLLEEHNPFITMLYRKIELSPLYDIEVFLYVQETQLDKFHQEMYVTNHCNKSKFKWKSWKTWWLSTLSWKRVKHSWTWSWKVKF